jgi:hypothetical protein
MNQFFPSERRRMREALRAIICLLVFSNLSLADTTPGFPNPAGAADTFSTAGGIDMGNEFFQVLGSNGRSCNTCHREEEGWSITPTGLQQRFNTSLGSDPVFRTNDGSNSPNAKTASLKDKRAAYSLLLNKGVIRRDLNIPSNAEFEVVGVSDPYSNVAVGSTQLSVFRRPLPSTNLRFLSAVMWDGRETFPSQSLAYDLRRQANSATTGHAQGTALTGEQRQHIVAFEMALHTAQIFNTQAGSLTVAKAGPAVLAKQKNYLGINDFLGDSRTGTAFNPAVFNLFNVWNDFITSAPTDIRAAIARGQKLFNSRTLTISGVPGLNDSPAFGSPAVLKGTCGTCHNTPNVGNHSSAKFLNIGISDESRRTGDMPLYTLRHKTTGALVKTSDPGRALVTGLWSDMGKFKVPVLRGLAARAPYFHNGMAAELGNVLDFYDSRFSLGLDNRERMDLILFLQSL